MFERPQKGDAMAGNSGAIRAGKAFVEIYADKSALVRGLRSVSGDLKSFGAAVAGIGKTLFAAGSAGVAAFSAAAKVFADSGSALNDMSARTGATVESLSSLSYAAGQVGASIEDVEVAFKGLVKAGYGRGLSADVAFRRAMLAVKATKDPLERAELAMRLFGKSGMKIIPLAAEFEALERRARTLGIVMSTVDAKAADELGDAWDDLVAIGHAVTVQVGAAVAPAFMEVANFLITATSETIKWVKANRGLVLAALQVSAVIAVAGGVIAAFGMATIAMGALTASVASVLVAVGAAISAMASPIGIAIAAVAALGLAFVTYTSAGQQALQFLSDAVFDLAADFGIAMGGISDALAAGDLALAAKIGLLLLEVEWIKAISFLSEAWSEFRDWLLGYGTDAITGFAMIFTDVSAGIETAWVNMTSFLQDAWTRFTAMMTSGWDTAQSWVASGILDLMKMWGDLTEELGFGGGMSTSDLADSKKTIEEDRKKKADAADAQKAKDLADIEARRSGRTGQIEADRATTNKDLQAGGAAEKAARDAKRASDAAANQREIDAAKKDLSGMSDYAKREAIRARAERLRGSSLGSTELDLGKTSTSGTFQGSLAGGLGTGTRMDEIATATKQTAKNTTPRNKKIGVT